MAYDWYDEIDQLVYHFESCVESAASSRSMLGMAPSAGDEARSRLRSVAAGLSPLQLIEEVESVTRSDVKDAAKALAEAAVDIASARGSRHVTREDVSAAISSASYPFQRG
jgi:histone H3/H4